MLCELIIIIINQNGKRQKSRGKMKELGYHYYYRLIMASKLSAVIFLVVVAQVSFMIKFCYFEAKIQKFD